MIRRVGRRLAALFRWNAAERDMDDELRDHVERQMEAFIRAGMTAADARRAALREFGGFEQSKEACRDARGLRGLQDLRQDVRYAARMLRTHAGLTVVVMATLGVGIGATTSLFSVVDTVLLKPLPYPRAADLVVIKESTEARPERSVAFPDFLDLKARQSTFDGMSAVMIIGGILSGDADAERVFGRAVTRDFFTTLGATLQLGRTFTEDEDQPGGARVLVLSYPLWQRRYGGDPGVVGRAVHYNGEPHTIVGVLPATFDYYGRTNANNDIFLPLGQFRALSYMTRRDSFPVLAIGRIKPGVSFEQARADLAAIGHALAVEYPASNTGVGVLVRPLLEDYVGDMRLTLMVLLGASGLVLTIACVNVANLLLARGSTRRQEIAVRLALGAGRGRIVRQVLTESLLLSLIGGAMGLFLAWTATQALVNFAPASLPRIEEVALDWRVAAVAAGITMITGIAFGLAPAVQTTDLQLQDVMRLGARSVAGTGHVLRHSLVVGQVALCVALLIGTGLLLRSFARVVAVDPGYQPQNVVSMRLRLPDARYRTREQVLPVLDDVRRRIAAMPGVEFASLTTGVPLGRSNNPAFAVAGRPAAPADRAPLALTQWVSADYHRTFGITLLAGRYFESADREGAADVAIVDDEFVRRHLPDRDVAGAVGGRVRILGDRQPWREIVGVVRHIRHAALDERPQAQLYVPFAQAEPAWQLEVGRAMDIAIRSAIEPDAMVAAVRKEIQSFDRDLPLSHVTTMEGAIERSVAPRLFNLVLLGAFGAAALLLCVVGIYGLVSYSVAQRTREIGVRLALGAQRRGIMRLVIGGGMRLVLVGVMAGVAGAVVLGRVMEGLLYGVSPRDPLTIAVVAGLLTVVAMLASYLPARRVTAVDVVATLRAD